MLERLSLAEAEGAAVFYHGLGCDRCKGRGYLGRVAIIEALPVSEAIRRLIIKRASAAVVKNQAVTEGMKTLRMVGIDKALEGITTLKEVWRVTGGGPLAMNIPFLSYFKKKAAPAARAAEQPRLAPLEKPSSERLSKTVMPNVGRPPSPADAFSPAGIGPLAGMLFLTTPAAPAAAEPRRTVSFGSNGGGGGGMAMAPASRTTSLPPAVALALEPKVERAISLELSDVVAQMPEGLVRPLKSEEATGRILLKAAGLERGMANGKPMVSVATIYQQVPEIFLRPVEAAEALQVALPFQQVLEQFTSLQVRGDQMREQAVPQVETPFLRVTIEDNSRFGMPPMEPPQTNELPPVRVQPATAESIAAAEPEPTSAIRIQIPEAPPPNGRANVAPAAAPTGEAAPPARIPFRFSPNGTDVPASGGVPASSGPSIPTSDAPGAAAPTRIPFNISAPTEELRPKAEPWLTKESFAMNGAGAPTAPAQPAAAVEQKPATVRLPLHAIFQSLAPPQVKGDLADVPEDASVELPFELIEPQLASGRVMVPPGGFCRRVAGRVSRLFRRVGSGRHCRPAVARGFEKPAGGFAPNARRPGGAGEKRAGAGGRNRCRTFCRA